MKSLFVLCLLAASIHGQKDPNVVQGRGGIVHLFEWKFEDVARECEDFLAPKGYGGVQVSPVSENAVVEKRPWYERYQPVSYIIASRSGDEAAFADMTRRCNAVGVRIYVDVIPNHMTGDLNSIGVAGSEFDAFGKTYPAVPYGPNDFHATCQIASYDDATQVRNCELDGLHDLDQGSDYVRSKIVAFLDRLVELGAAGFRVDAAKHMWPADLKVIYESVRNLNTEHGFAVGARPFYFQEVVDVGDGAVSKYEYTDLGRVQDFRYGGELGSAFRGNNPIKNLFNFGSAWGLLDDGDALVFIDNHDNQRAGGQDNPILTYKEPKLYKMAVAFMLSWPHGYPRVMSSFAFTDASAGPPADQNGNILGPDIADGICGNGWVCEHRWRQIFNMVEFRNVVAGTGVNDWWDNGDKHIAFCRGGKGFIAFNDGGTDFTQTLQTCLSAGIYCDVISGGKAGNACSGKSVTVGDDGTARIDISLDEYDGVLAIHVNSKALAS